MSEQMPYYIQKMKEDLSRRQRNSSSYSLRAYARDLNLHPATLSLMFKGQRALPLKNSLFIVDKLNLGPKERTYFFESLHRAKVSLDDIKIDPQDNRFILDESFHTVIAEWEHYAVLTLFDCQDFFCVIPEITARLGITQLRAETVCHNLVTAGLLKPIDNGFEKTTPHLRTTEDVTNLALKKSHLENLEIGKEKLELDVLMRDFSATMYAVDPKKMTEAKTIIREFRQKMGALLKDGEKTEVYQLAIQFYPLTETQQGKELC